MSKLEPRIGLSQWVAAARRCYALIASSLSEMRRSAVIHRTALPTGDNDTIGTALLGGDM